VQAQGWYLDPYGIHNDRWYSCGQPTSLVRDSGIESRDAPPSWQPEEEPVPVPLAQGGADDLKRAGEFNWQDAPDQPFDALSVIRAVLDLRILGPLPATWSSWRERIRS